MLILLLCRFVFGLFRLAFAVYYGGCIIVSGCWLFALCSAFILSASHSPQRNRKCNGGGVLWLCGRVLWLLSVCISAGVCAAGVSVGFRSALGLFIGVLPIAAVPRSSRSYYSVAAVHRMGSLCGCPVHHHSTISNCPVHRGRYM